MSDTQRRAWGYINGRDVVLGEAKSTCKYGIVGLYDLDLMREWSDEIKELDKKQEMFVRRMDLVEELADDKSSS